MKLWTTWTAACLISVSSLLFIPLQTSVGEGLDRTSLTQTAKETIVSNTATKPIPDLRSESSLAATINSWRATLAHEKGFEGWQTAAWNSYPLGPGTHGWVIILTDHGQDVGYMIVHATENGSFRLTEYGTGNNPLFSLTTLYRSLIQQELIPATTSYSDFIQNEMIMKNRLYMDSLTAVWKVNIQDQTYYLDAKSGEVLPLKDEPKPSLTDTLIKGTKLQGKATTVLYPAFDPYDRLPWVQGNPLSVTGLKEFQNALNLQDKLTYVTELYEGQVTLPLAILGYQLWEDGDSYLTLDHVGPRYVLLEAALRQGHIYP
ncbi:hypothetical protein SAMN04487897_111125 [Paenibacillus sp. yr247]|uniref:hypothetical protein n=1 Tax=Paenibacillus sp. yr247 TaxID=1761880 RepID=UPI0008917C96|nr:hypothetical protein [Paenibacillus sp. yr247]SDO30332.1 hypothetical protein SAMN04487897_111125 [Paenibacillus sp. yr247]